MKTQRRSGKQEEEAKPEAGTTKGVNRRTFIKVAAAGAVLLMGGGVWRMTSQGVFSAGKGPAYEPWDDWDSEGQDAARSIVRAAILASSPHNSQPWLFRIAPDKVDLFADPSRNLGAMDPLLREMHIGLGCALENMSITAAAHGLKAEIAYVPDPGNPAHIASLRLSPGTGLSRELHEYIPRRHTNRSAYDVGRQVEADQLRALSEGGDNAAPRTIWLQSDEDKTRIGQLIVEATEAITQDPDQSRDSNRWFRHNWKQLQQSADGVTIDASGNSAFARTLGKTLPNLSNEQSDAYWLTSTRLVQVPTASAFGIILIPDQRDVAGLLHVGRLWQRMHLRAVRDGLAVQPLNQIHERADREEALGSDARFGRALKELTAGYPAPAPTPAPANAAVFTFRIGYELEPALKSPRRPIGDVLLPT